MKANKYDTIICLLSDGRGQYIPRDFITDNDNEIAKEHCARWHIDDDDAIILCDPENPDYWETWDHVEQSAFFSATKEDGIKPGKWTLYQDGDLFAVHESHVWED